MTRIFLNRSSGLLPALLLCCSLLALSPPVRAQEGESLLLVWDANQEEDLRGYRVYECDGSGTPTALVDELLVKEIPSEDRDEGIASVQVLDVPPGFHCWTVTAFDKKKNESVPCSPACITIESGPPPIHMADYHEDGFYGCHPQGKSSYDNGVVYTFDGKPGALLLAFRVWDVNSPTEVEILLNGESLGYATMTGDRELSRLQTIRVPPERLEIAGLNTLSFNWNPDDMDDLWAVGMVEILELIPLPAPDFYGNLLGVTAGDTSHPRSVGFMFEGRAGSPLLFYQAFDVDREGEVGIFLNGERIGSVPATGNNTFAAPPALVLPDDLVLDEGVNTLVFTNALNPPRALMWGVGNVRVP